jgi:nicotinamide phosphoribosyltransferase
MKESILLVDGYKLGHHLQYPEGTEMVYSNWTPRSNKYFPEATEGSVVFGLQYLIKEYLMKQMDENFFSIPKERAVSEFVKRVNNFVGIDNVGYEHIEKLHDLGYLPIEIKALPEGSICPIRVPMITIKNTLPEFFWLTNYLETLMSCILWMPCTSATSSRLYKKELKRHAEKTGFPDEVNIGFSCHDFSMRGMAGVEAAIISGMAHLTSFCGSETIPAIRAIEEYYNADSSKELVAATVPATEHSVMCSGGKEDELETFKRLIKDIYPKGFVSIVSDTWDFWQVIEDFLPKLKKDIMARDGRVVIRPDSGDPVDIICGLRTNSHYLTRIKEGKYYCSYNPFSEDDEWVEVSVGQYYGAYYMLGNIFGWNTTKNGYLYPSEKIGLLYGDSITLERQKQIYLRLEGANMAACNLVLGVGSYTFQYKSRDSLGFAVKATAVRINGRLQEIFKQPKTDDGTKNSLRGLIKVIQADKTYIAVDRVSEEDEKTGCLETVFKDGVLLKDYSLQEIRSRINSTLC